MFQFSDSKNLEVNRKRKIERTKRQQKKRHYLDVPFEKPVNNIGSKKKTFLSRCFNMASSIGFKWLLSFHECHLIQLECECRFLFPNKIGKNKILCYNFQIKKAIIWLWPITDKTHFILFIEVISLSFSTFSTVLRITTFMYIWCYVKWKTPRQNKYTQKKFNGSKLCLKDKSKREMMYQQVY